MELTAELGGELIDPIKTTIVQNQRSMTPTPARIVPTTTPASLTSAA